jgi:predicted ATPase/DNA-binding winged helix-turn-helix (wHTH) protein
MTVDDGELIEETEDCGIDLARRELRARGVAVPLGSRAFDVVETLVRCAGDLVTKDRLLTQVWPGALVEENTLQVHISAVRKALGPHRAMLKTESGRGYRLLGNWVRRHNAVGASSINRPPIQRRAQASGADLPASLGILVGRSAAAQRLSDLLSAYRVVTLTGPGGIGKTALALEVGRNLRSRFDDGSALVELAPLTDPALVPSSAAATLALGLASDASSAETVARAIADKNILLILDNCEHLIDATAQMAETIIRLCPQATVLATSREALRVDGEYVYRVPPLDVPPSDQIESTDLLSHSAIELFVARISALNASFALEGADHRSAIAAICRRLDGIPLAIEFAASRAAAFGVHYVANGLEDRFALLTEGRRTALPRHRTLHAALDWSYDLLTEEEQRLFRHLGVFFGAFTLDAVTAVYGGSTAVAALAETIGNLVAKSLVTFDGSATLTRWRLLETTRVYALEKLSQCAELDAATRRHAEYHADVLGRARGDWENAPTAIWLAEHSHRLDDLRASLDWAFSSAGDTSLGLNLIVDAVPLWMQLSLMGECRRRVEQGLSKIEAETSENLRLRMRLWTALALSRMYIGDPLTELDASWKVVLELAEQVGDPDYQRRGIWGLFAGTFNGGRFRAALEFAKRFHQLAANPSDKLIGERLIGTALHFLGDQKSAREHVEHMLGEYRAPVTSSHIIRFQNDQVIAARRVLAPVLWVQGYPDQAMRIVETAVSDALSHDHALTLCNFLAQAGCPVAFLAGDLDAAERLTAILLKYAAQHSLDVWIAHGRCFEGSLLISAGNLEAGLRRLLDGGGALRAAGFLQNYVPYLATLAEARGAAGQVQSGLRAIDEALTRAGDTEEQWNLAELLRIKGELLRQTGEEVAAIACLQQAVNTAEEQKALSWKLRAASSLARLRIAQGHNEEARNILAPVYGQFTEGFGTADLRAAKTLLDSLPRVPSV